MILLVLDRLFDNWLACSMATNAWEFDAETVVACDLTESPYWPDDSEYDEGE